MNKTADCGCGSGYCCGGGKPAGISRVVRFIAFIAIVAAAAFLIVRGMTKGAKCAPGACAGTPQAAGDGCCGDGK